MDTSSSKTPMNYLQKPNGVDKNPIVFYARMRLFCHGQILITSNLPRILPEELLGCGFFFSVSVLNCCKLFY